MAQWLFANDNTTPLSGLASTALLSDVGVDDATTGPTEASAADQDSDPNPCGNVAQAIAYQQIVWDGGADFDITAIRHTGKCRTTVGFGSECISPGSNPVKAFSAKIYHATSPAAGPVGGSGWTLLQTDALADGISETNTWAGAITARFVGILYTSDYFLDQSTSAITAHAQATDLRVTGSQAASDCPLPVATKDLSRGTRENFAVDGNTAPDLDEWEIYRCIANVLTLIDSGMLGLPGLDGWEVASADGQTFDIYAPMGAIIADDYEARIDESASFFSINFNVVESSTEQTRMAERPFVFEQTRYGKQGTAGQPVVAGRKSQMLGLAPPTPMEPSTSVQTPGNRNPTELIAQKGHTEASLTGPMGFADLVEMLSSLFGSPVIKTPVGATLARDIIFQPPVARDENYHFFTWETGTEDFPSRFSDGSLVSATLSMGKTENTFEAQVIGQRILESLAAFTDSSPDLVPLLPVAPKDNAYFMGTIWWGLGTVEELCETQNFSLTAGQRRVPHFTQCDGEDTWDVMIPTAEELLASLSLSHKGRSRAYLANLRDKTQLYFKWLNTGPTIEGSLKYEAEIIFPTKFQGTSRGESDSVTAGIHELKPNYDPIFNPHGLGTLGGYIAFRFRVKSTDYDFANATPV